MKGYLGHSCLASFAAKLASCAALSALFFHPKHLLDLMFPGGVVLFCQCVGNAMEMFHSPLRGLWLSLPVSCLCLFELLNGLSFGVFLYLRYAPTPFCKPTYDGVAAARCASAQLGPRVQFLFEIVGGVVTKELRPGLLSEWISQPFGGFRASECGPGCNTK